MMKRQPGYSPVANDVANDIGAEGWAGASSSALNDLVQVAARAMQVPLAVIMLDATAPRAARTVVAACTDDPWVRDHAAVDFARLVDPRMAEAHGLAFYAAVSLRDADDATIGTLAVLARHPRPVSTDDLVMLKRLARLVCAVQPLSSSSAS